MSRRRGTCCRRAATCVPAQLPALLASAGMRPTARQRVGLRFAQPHSRRLAPSRSLLWAGDQPQRHGRHRRPPQQGAGQTGRRDQRRRLATGRGTVAFADLISLPPRHSTEHRHWSCCRPRRLRLLAVASRGPQSQQCRELARWSLRRRWQTSVSRMISSSRFKFSWPSLDHIQQELGHVVARTSGWRGRGSRRADSSGRESPRRVRPRAGPA